MIIMKQFMRLYILNLIFMKHEEYAGRAEEIEMDVAAKMIKNVSGTMNSTANTCPGDMIAPIFGHSCIFQSASCAQEPIPKSINAIFDRRNSIQTN